MNNDLISREALKKALHNEIGDHALSIAIDRVIDNAPTVSDLISREALKKAFTEECCGCCDNCLHCLTGYKCGLIDNAPTEDNHEYKCEDCKHKDNCVRVSAFLMANVCPYSDGCECFEKK